MTKDNGTCMYLLLVAMVQDYRPTERIKNVAASLLLFCNIYVNNINMDQFTKNL